MPKSGPESYTYMDGRKYSLYYNDEHGDWYYMSDRRWIRYDGYRESVGYAQCDSSLEKNLEFK